MPFFGAKQPIDCDLVFSLSSSLARCVCLACQFAWFVVVYRSDTAASSADLTSKWSLFKVQRNKQDETRDLFSIAQN